MIALLFFISVLINGSILTARFFSIEKTSLKIISIFLTGSVISVSLIYLLSNLTQSLKTGLIVYLALLLIFWVVSLRKNVFEKLALNLSKWEVVVYLIIFLFSWYLFSKSFGYEDGSFLISSNTYLDFGAHISFIRSFSLGNNFPSEVPFFANKGLVYYFMFDFYTAILEFLGLRIDLAYNLLSSIAFSLVLVLIYQLPNLIFKTGKKIIGILSVILFLFSSNLSFLLFFQKYGINFNLVSSFWHNAFYLEGSVIPLSTQLEIANFWNLNPFVNQRHFVFGILFFLFLIYYSIHILRNKTVQRNDLVYSVLLGLFPLWHTVVFISSYFVLGMFFLLQSQVRKRIFVLLCISFLIAIPSIILITLNSSREIIFNPGFLISDKLNIQNFTVFWVFNLGITIFTAIFGFILVNRNVKKFILAFMILFIAPNIFHFSSRFYFDDHKFFNLWIILINIISAYFLWYLFRYKFLGKLIFVVVFLALTASGYISFMVIKNSVNEKMVDYTSNALMKWSKNNIPQKDVILTNGEIYDPISLIGRKTIIGRVNYIYVYGGNPQSEINDKLILLNGKDEKKINEIIKKRNIKYVVIYKSGFAKNEQYANINFYRERFKKLYEDENGVIFKI